MTVYCSRPLPDLQTLISGYLSFIRRHRGLLPKTCRRHRGALLEFLNYLAARCLSLTQVQAKDLDDYILHVAQRGKSRSYLSMRITVLRGFLSYLFGEGWFKQDLSPLVESPLIYREATVPPHFTWSEIERLLVSIAGDDREALRDRAMLALLCGYGLRSSEVAGLTIDDVDWGHKLLWIRNRKSESPLLLPLLPAVETALGEYMKKGRQCDVPYREILLKNNGKPMQTGVAITYRLHKLVKRAGLKGGRGCHAIRRAVGTRLLEQGRGIAEVALLLGHKDLNSTRVYLRLSMELLRDVADNYGEML